MNRFFFVLLLLFCWSSNNTVQAYLTPATRPEQIIELQLDALRQNVPFADKEIFFGPIMEHTDQKVSLIPDFISNCGMARVFAYFMERKVQMTDEAIFSDTSKVIRKALKEVKANNPHNVGISETAFEIALRQLI